MTTAEIEEKIRSTKRFSTKLIEENPPPDFVAYLQQCMDEKGVRKSELIRILNIHRNYGYQMLNGTRMPTREQLLRIVLYLGLSVEKAQRLINLAGREALYVRRQLDARVVHCLEHGMSYKKACAFVWRDE